ncbi:MAG: TonB-dependent receptor [Halioglobus sp.]|nr:TonB-dependent receptor [Halioglobus sp.]
MILWEPTSDFNLRLIYHDIEDDFDIDPVVKGQGLEFDDRIALADFASTMKNETDYAIAEINYTFANDWIATLAASSQDNTITRIWDDDASPVQGSEQTVISKVTGLENYELRLASQGNDLWDWTVGAFYQESDSETPVFANTFRTPGPGFLLLTKTTGPAIISADVFALFSHNTIHVSERGTMTVGVRYNSEQSDSVQNFTNELAVVNPDGTLGPPTTFEFVGIVPEDQETDDDAITGTLKYQYRFRDDLMAYASYDRGWRRGSANVAGQPNPPVFGAFDAEESDNLELGFKWDLLGGRGLLNVAAYYQLYTDFQFQADSVEFRSPDGTVQLASPVVNVDEAESYGIDSDLTVLLSQNWRLGAALSSTRPN